MTERPISRRRPGRVALLAAALAAIAAGPLAAQSEPPPAAPAVAEVPPEQQVENRRADLARDLASVRAKLESADASGDGRRREHLAREIELLERADSLLAQQLAALNQRTDLETARAELARELEGLRTGGPEQKPPYTFPEVEALRDLLDAERQRGPRVEAGVRAAGEAHEQARRGLEEKERARRLAREAAEGNTDPARAEELGRRLRIAQLESRVATELAELRGLELADEEIRRAIYQLRLELAAEKVRWFQRGARFSEQDLQKILVELASLEEDLRQEAERADRNAEYFLAQMADARRRLDAAAEPQPALTEEVEARRLGHDAARQQSLTIAKRLERLAGLRAAWTRRFEIANETAETSERSLWQNEARAALSQLEIATKLQVSDLAGARNDLLALQSRLDAAGDAGARRWLSEQKRQLESLIATFEANLSGIEAARRVHQRLLDEIQAGRVPLVERLKSFGRSAAAVWDYELAAVDDRPITVGKVVIGLILLVLGLFASRGISALVGRRLLRRLGIPEGAAAAFQALIFYVLLALFALFALRLVNVPLTVFTIAGGALAIGVGFGSQTVIKNFISGLILHAERPIRIGDLIQVGELYGIVERVGARSTRIRTGENIEIVVPNGSFLEQNVINWTLSDPKIRVSVSVGVVYGSPTREVSRLLHKVVTEHGRVLKHPAPTVIFTDFGDNSLQFQVHFWIQMRSIMDRRIIESDIRYRIDHLFREAGIVIAFPQRDVHLDAARPIDVRVVPEAAATTTRAGVAEPAGDGSDPEKDPPAPARREATDRT